MKKFLGLIILSFLFLSFTSKVHSHETNDKNISKIECKEYTDTLSQKAKKQLAKRREKVKFLGFIIISSIISIGLLGLLYIAKNGDNDGFGLAG